MPRFSANLGFLWQELSLPDRIFAARDAGFAAVECHFPYDIDPTVISAALQEAGLSMLALNTYPGEVDDGEFGLCAVPGEERRARQAIDQAVHYAAQINAKRIHVMAGLTGDDPEAMACFINNLAYASHQANDHQLGILVEPINRIDKPNYLLHRTAQAIQLIEVLQHKHQLQNIGLMFDCYHVQMGEGNILSRLSAALPFVAHIQIAAVPGRGEPDTGEINYPWLYSEIDALGYTGYIGAEYIPAHSTTDGLGWFLDYRNSNEVSTT